MATPASWENVTPVFGIRWPKPTAPAKNLPDMFGHGFTDVEAALLAAGQVPPSMTYVTGTKAQRQAATPTRNVVWVETDTGDVYVGTGTAWVKSSSAPPAAFSDRSLYGNWKSYTGPPAYRRAPDGTIQVRGATLGVSVAAVMNVGQGAQIASGLPAPRAGYTYRCQGFISGGTAKAIASVEVDSTGKLSIANLGTAALTMAITSTHDWSNCAVIPNFWYEPA